MTKQQQILEILANDILNRNADNGGKPNYSNRDFMNALIVFQDALMDKMFDVMEFDKMPLIERNAMANKSGEELRKFIFTYTNLDTRKVEEFI